jgi:hypothetical protein
MLINKKLLHIPPFISTSWKDVELLLGDGHHSLNIYLKNGTLVQISHLSKEELDLIFQVHQEILLAQASSKDLTLPHPLLFQFSHQFLEQDPQISDTTSLSDAVKIKLLSVLDQMIPQEHTHAHPDSCSCAQCTLINFLSEKNQTPDEIVCDEDLQFATWIVDPLESQNYKLTHPYHPDETYFVCLNHPICCSCGQPGCEHIEHVLKT